jgi:hypothetical protein
MVQIDIFLQTRGGYYGFPFQKQERKKRK